MGDLPPEKAVADFRIGLRYEMMAIELEMPVKSTHMRWIAEHIDELRGKNLACWCPLDAVCHADALLRIANRPGV